MVEPMLIGLSGYAGSGKSAVAAALVRDHGFVVASASDPLRRLLFAIDPIVFAMDDLVLHASDVGEVGNLERYEEVKQIGETRALLQRLGRALRDEFGENVLIDHALNQFVGFDRVSPTIRFPSDAVAIRRRGGFVVRVDRPGVGPVNDDITETAMDGQPFDATIVNDGTLEDLALETTAMLEGLSDRLGVLPLT